MARRKEQPLKSFSSVLMPDGSIVRTVDLPPDVWAAKKKELAKTLCEAYAEALQRSEHDMMLIYHNPERFGATIQEL